MWTELMFTKVKKLIYLVDIWTCIMYGDMYAFDSILCS